MAISEFLNRSLFEKRSLFDSLIPISRFNRGEANKIFDEVGRSGLKIVLKNNSPVSVLLSPSRYNEILDALEDYALYFEAEKRMAASKDNYLTSAEVLSSLGISDSDLDEVEVEIE